EETGWQLLATENSEGELICRVATHTSSNKNEWQMIDLPAAITESVSSVTLYNAETARYLTAVTDSSVAMTVAASTCSQWHILIIEGTSSCRIMSQYYSNKCLAADADGNLSIAAIDNSNNAQRWYVTCTNGVYSIVNEQYSNYLYTAEDASGNISCGAGKASAEEQKSWNYSTSIPDVIVTLSGVGRSDAYLNNVSGLNYDGEKLGISTYDDSDGYDRFGFRLVYLPQTDAYKILPISSCNGNYRVLTNDGPGAIVSIYSYSENSANQKFNLELQSDGTYVISLKSDSSSVLTIYQNHAIMSTRSSSLTNQKWELELYQYTSPQSVDSSTSGNYIDVETYYKSLGFRSPFRNIQKDSAGNIVNVSDGSVTVTSDFGKRLKSLYDEKTEQNVLVDDSHEGLDISGSEGTPLFGVSTGRVVYIDDIPNSASGRFIIVETDYYEYQSNGQQTGRKIYYIYMHMQSISVALNTEITDDNIDTLELGKVGCSGYGEYTYSAHLHLGVFLADAGLNDEFSTYQPWVKNVDCNSAINPLLFLVPNNCSIIRTQP
ncbi:MAG: hypothetical protein E7616_08525, partial [Ruminococcaceae bacterium]|nr:hypothetical protein [Oscillospiraceae bacterium]